jgi:hypothetical protein
MLQYELQKSEYNELNDAEALSRLLETVSLPDDKASYSYQGVTEKLGSDVAAVALMHLKKSSVAADGDSVAVQGKKALMEAELASFQVRSQSGEAGGLDFSQPERQSQIDEWIAAAGDDAATVAALTALKRLGKPVAPRWKSVGIDAEPTLQQVTNARSINSASATENLEMQLHNTRRTRIDSLHDTDLTAEQIATEIATIRADPEKYAVPGGGE